MGQGIHICTAMKTNTYGMSYHIYGTRTKKSNIYITTAIPPMILRNFGYCEAI